MAWYRCSGGSDGGSDGGSSNVAKVYDAANGEYMQNKYITTAGTVMDYNGWLLTDYIDVTGATAIYVFTTNNRDSWYEAKWCACYDSEKNVINTAASRTGALFIPPSETAYIRISDYSTFVSGLKVIIEK